MSTSSYANVLAWFYSSSSSDAMAKLEVAGERAGPARNAPPNKPLKDLSSTVAISVKDLDKNRLRHVEPKARKKWFPPRHPVLQELMYRTEQKKKRRMVCAAISQYFSEDAQEIEFRARARARARTDQTI